MPDSQALLLGGVVLALVVWLAWGVWSRARDPVGDPGDLYRQGLEALAAGGGARAEKLLGQAIALDPNAIEPYLMLGNLMRHTGRTDQAAVLHRSLTVRSDLSGEQRLRAGLALAEDLMDLGAVEEAGYVLDGLARIADRTPGYWRLLHRKFRLMGDDAEAARCLDNGSRRLTGPDRDAFVVDRDFFRLDRAWAAAAADDDSAARRWLKDIDVQGPANSWRPLVEAVLLAHDDNFREACDLATAELSELPAGLVAFHRQLRPLLLERNLFNRAIPMLERVVQASDAPLELVLELVLLLDKTGHRDRALKVVADNKGRPGFTTEIMGPWLDLLVREEGGKDLQTAWNSLKSPQTVPVWVAVCGHPSKGPVWSCPDCGRCGPPGLIRSVDRRERV